MNAQNKAIRNLCTKLSKNTPKTANEGVEKGP